MTTNNHILPYSLEAEQSVIGGLLIDNNAWDMVADCLSETDFYRHEHRSIYLAVSQLAIRQIPFDILTVAEQLKSQHILDNVGGESYLYELAAKVPSVANITAYADIVRDRSMTRSLAKAASEVLEGARTLRKPAIELLDEAESKLLAIAEHGSMRRGEPLRFDTICQGAFEDLAKLAENGSEITGLPTGFADLDYMTSGLQRSDLIIIAGRPSMGKTALAMNMAENAILGSAARVLIFSLEMSSKQLALRMMASCGVISQIKLRNAKLLLKDEWRRVGDATSALSKTQLYIDDSAGLTPADIRSRARRLMRQEGDLSLIIIDYLQLLTMPGYKQNRVQEVSAITRSLKLLAKELNVPLIALSQLNRNVENRQDKRPVMSDLRDSGSVEQDSDLIIFIYRDEVYNEASPDRGTAELIISKQRSGPTGKIKLKFFGEYAKFSNLSIQKF